MSIIVTYFTYLNNGDKNKKYKFKNEKQKKSRIYSLFFILSYIKVFCKFMQLC